MYDNASDCGIHPALAIARMEMVLERGFDGASVQVMNVSFQAEVVVSVMFLA